MNRKAWGLSVVFIAACGGTEDAAPDLFAQRALNVMPAAQPSIVGTGAIDLWMQLYTPPGVPLMFGHTQGGEQWASASIGDTGNALGMASLEPGVLWVLGTGPTVLSSFTLNGFAVVDHTSELAGTHAEAGEASMMADFGGLFVATRDDADALHISRYVDGAFVELENAPAGREARVLAVVGPDEAYFSLSTQYPGSYTYFHYKAGAWTPIADATLNEHVLVVAHSNSDVWLWRLKFLLNVKHCNGATCTDIDITDWPSSNPNAPGIITPFAILPVASNQLAFICATPLTQDHGTASIVSIRIDASGEVLSNTRLFGCDHHNCEYNAEDVVMLDDGTVVLVDAPDWHVGTRDLL